MKTKLFKKLLYPPSTLSFFSAGIDISNRSIKFLEFNFHQGSVSLKKSGIVPLEQGIFFNGDVLNKDALVQALKIVKSRLSYDFVRVSVSESKTYIFDVRMPRVAHSEVRQALEFKLEENVPFKADEVAFEYKIIEEGKEYLLVNVSVIPKRVIGAFLDVLDTVGFNTVSFEIESRMIARSCVSSREHGNVITVYIKNDTTVMSFVTDGTVRFSSTIAIGANTIRDVLKEHGASAGKYNINEKDFIRKPFGDQTDILTNIFSVMKDEVEKFYQYIITQAQRDALLPDKVEQVILCGIGANLPGFARHIGQNLDIPVSLANIWVNTLDLETQLPPMSFEESLGFATAAGLATPSHLRRHA